MLFRAENAWGATIHDLDRDGEKIDDVLWVDTDTGTVCAAAHNPIRMTPGGDRIQTRRHVFRRVWPIFAGQSRPVMFQCLDRISRRAP